MKSELIVDDDVKRVVIRPSDAPSSRSIPQLVQEIGQQMRLLAQKQLELAKTEIASDLKSEAVMIGGIGIAVAMAFLAVMMLLVTAVLALGRIMPDWAAGLLMAAFLLIVGVVAGFFGWSKRVTNPLVRTREQFKDSVELTKRMKG